MIKIFNMKQENLNYKFSLKKFSYENEVLNFFIYDNIDNTEIIKKINFKENCKVLNVYGYYINGDNSSIPLILNDTDVNGNFIELSSVESNISFLKKLFGIVLFSVYRSDNDDIYIYSKLCTILDEIGNKAETLQYSSFGSYIKENLPNEYIAYIKEVNRIYNIPKFYIQSLQTKKTFITNHLNVQNDFIMNFLKFLKEKENPLLEEFLSTNEKYAYILDNSLGEHKDIINTSTQSILENSLANKNNEYILIEEYNKMIAENEAIETEEELEAFKNKYNF